MLVLCGCEFKADPQRAPFSCFGRFSFQDSLIKSLMFFDVHHLSTGNGVAHFVFDKLVQFNCSFEKLVCVSSDGASNMIGNSNGMTIAWKQLILQHCAERQISFNEFHSVWCFAHRLNLVTKDLLECERLNVVKAFSDWFSDRRRQVHFKAFLSQKTFNKNSNASHSLRTQDGCFTETLFPRFCLKTHLLKRSSKSMMALGRSGIL